MSFKDLWLKYEDWIYALVLVGIVVVYTYWYLSLKPQDVLSFLVPPAIAFVIVTLLALRPEIRERLVKALIAHRTKQKEMGGWLFRYHKIALLLFFIIILTFPLFAQSEIIPLQYTPWAILGFFIILLALGALQVAWLIRVSGKWGLFLIALIASVAILRILVWKLSQST